MAGMSWGWRAVVHGGQSRAGCAGSPECSPAASFVLGEGRGGFDGDRRDDASWLEEYNTLVLREITCAGARGREKGAGRSARV